MRVKAVRKTCHLPCVCSAYPGPDAFHHYAPNMAPRATAEWYCANCWGRGNERYRNNGSRTACRKCNSPKGSCHWGPVKPRQADGQAAGGAPSDPAKKLREAESQLRKQQEEIKQLKAAAETASADGGGSVGGDDVDTAALDKSISKLRTMVQATKAMGAEAPEGWLADVEARLAAAILAKEEARPPSDRLASARNAQARTKKAYDKTQAAQHAAQRILEEAQEGILKATNENAAACEAHAKATAAFETASVVVEAGTTAGDAVPDLPAAIKTIADVKKLLRVVTPAESTVAIEAAVEAICAMLNKVADGEPALPQALAIAPVQPQQQQQQQLQAPQVGTLPPQKSWTDAAEEPDVDFSAFDAAADALSESDEDDEKAEPAERQAALKKRREKMQTLRTETKRLQGKLGVRGRLSKTPKSEE